VAPRAVDKKLDIIGRLGQGGVERGQGGLRPVRQQPDLAGLRV
jgi:hypothetical protein